jgi:hypothetical protein
MADWRAIFDEVDEDKDGHLDIKELEVCVGNSKSLLVGKAHRTFLGLAATAWL